MAQPPGAKASGPVTLTQLRTAPVGHNLIHRLPENLICKMSRQRDWDGLGIPLPRTLWKVPVSAGRV